MRLHADPLKGEFQFSYSALGPLDVSPIGFLSKMFWGLVFLVQILRVGVPDMRYQSYSSRRGILDW